MVPQQTSRLLLVACVILVNALAPAHSQTERQTHLVLPKMMPDVKPELVPQVGHSDQVRAVCFSPDGAKVASVSSFGKGIIWDVQTGRAEMTVGGQHSLWEAVAFSPDGKCVAAGSRRGDLVICDAETGEPVRTLHAHLGTAFSLWYSPDGDRLASVSVRGETTIWNPHDGRVVATFKEDTQAATSLSFSSDGGKLACVTSRGDVVIWDVEAGEVVRRWKPWQNDGGRALAVCIRPHGVEMVAQVGTRNPSTVEIWDARTRKRTRTLRGHTEPVFAAAFSPDGSRLAAMARPRGNLGAETAIIVWDLRTHEPGAVLGGQQRDGPFPTGWVKSVAFSRGSTKLVGACFDEVVIWDAQTGEVYRALGETRRFRSLQVWRLAFGPRGRKLASLVVSRASGASMVVVWDVVSGQPHRVLDRWTHAWGIELDPGGDSLALWEGPDIALWDLEKGELKRTLKGHSDRVRAVSFAPNGRGLASASDDTTVILWDIEGGQALAVLRGHDAKVVSVAFSPDGRWLASGAVDGTVIIWNRQRRQEHRRLKGHTHPVNCLAFAPDGKALVSASDGGTAILWDVESGEAQRTFKRRASPSLSIVLNIERKKLIWACKDGRIIMYDTGTGRTEQEMVLDKGLGPAIALGADGHRAAAAYADVRTEVWDVSRGRSLATFLYLDRERGWLSTTPEGYYDSSVEASQFVVWRLGNRLYPFDQFSEKFHRPDLVRRALAGEDISDAPPLDGTQIPPNILFASPEYGDEVTGDEVEVAIEVAGVYPIKRVDVSVNGRPAPIEVAKALEVADPTEKLRTFRVSVPLPPNEPSVRLRAVAYDTELLKSRPAELFLRRKGIEQKPGKLFVLSIGLSRYEKPAWNTLQFADDDAGAFAETFIRQQAGQYEAIEKRVLTDEEATVSNVKFAARWLKDTATEGDVAVVFIAGHGVERAGDYHFLCHDTNEADLHNTALPWQDFVNVLREVRAKRVMLFVDTCHAGFVTGWRTTDQLIDRLNRKAGVLVFAASRGEEPSIERDEWGHGAFTKALLEAFEGKADLTPKDGMVTLQELKDFTIRRVEELTSGQQHAYLPRIQDFEPEAVMARPAQ